MNYRKETDQEKDREVVSAILNKLMTVHQAEREELIYLLEIRESDLLELLFSSARKIRDQVFFKKVFLYGFVYFSTWCKNHCNFCYYRKSNPIERYRKSPEEILAISQTLSESGVHLIDLTMGEDSVYSKDNFDSILNIITKIKQETDLPVMISPGVLKEKILDQFARVGTDWYALYQETHNQELFQQLRVGQDYEERMKAKLYAKSKGLLIEEGILVGVGESLADIVDSLFMMGHIGARQMRVMSYVPQKGIPMEGRIGPDRKLEYKIIAILRLLYPEALIPASLDIDGIAGLKKRMNAGANVVTSIIPPLVGISGVAQSKMDVDEGGRSVEEVVAILEDLGLQAASKKEYIDFIGGLK